MLEKSGKQGGGGGGGGGDGDGGGRVEGDGLLVYCRRVIFLKIFCQKCIYPIISSIFETQCILSKSWNFYCRIVQYAMTYVRNFFFCKT